MCSARLSLPCVTNQDLLNRAVSVAGVDFDFLDVAPYPQIFKRMGRDLEFDVCELSVMTYFAARDRGLPISAIPMVPRHLFHHGDFLKNVHAGIEEPSDLAGDESAPGRGRSLLVSSTGGSFATSTASTSTR